MEEEAVAADALDSVGLVPVLCTITTIILFISPWYAPLSVEN